MDILQIEEQTDDEYEDGLYIYFIPSKAQINAITASNKRMAKARQMIRIGNPVKSQ